MCNLPFLSFHRVNPIKYPIQLRRYSSSNNNKFPHCRCDVNKTNEQFKLYKKIFFEDI